MSRSRTRVLKGATIRCWYNAPPVKRVVINNKKRQMLGGEGTAGEREMCKSKATGQQMKQGKESVEGWLHKFTHYKLSNGKRHVTKYIQHTGDCTTTVPWCSRQHRRHKCFWRMPWRDLSSPQRSLFRYAQVGRGHDIIIPGVMCSFRLFFFLINET